MTFIPNIENKKCVDHVNNDNLDNTISNLRWCNLSENQYNRQMNENNTSGVKSVYYNSKTKKWRAHIMINKKNLI